MSIREKLTGNDLYMAKWRDKMDKKWLIFAILIWVVCFAASNVGAEITETEKEVVAFMSYLQEMTFTGEYTEGIPKKEMEMFLNSNIDNLAKVYKVSSHDISALMLHIKDKKQLPTDYKAPSMPSQKEREWLDEEVKKSIGACWKHSKYYKKENK